MARIRSSLFLVGMMGAGKSTIGRLMAASAGFDFVDCDRELEHRAGTTIANIFELEGEPCDSIAAALGVEVGTVYSRLHRARHSCDGGETFNVPVRSCQGNGNVGESIQNQAAH